MFNFKELSKAHHSLSQRDKNRVDKSKSAYASGLSYLQQYTQRPSRELIKKAIAQFKTAIQLSRAYLAPYIALSNLYYGMNLLGPALRYFQAARELDPSSEYVLKLQQLLTSKEKISSLESPEVSVDWNSTKGVVLDYDQLYDDTEELIQREVQFTMTMQLLLRPTPDPEQIQTLQQSQQLVQNKYTYILHQLEVIDAEIDTEELRKQLKPVELRLKQINRLLEQCLIMRNLTEQLMTLIARVQHELAAVQPQEAELELFLDQCDALADQINALEQQKIAIQELEILYSQLVTKINELQEWFDHV
ncbi:hypothetical protein COW36_03060 [bacterium (Candidatus Blackallbacteria) CG17_big_fil_post_rev_8_21_14_2_50_48_46]|uniref:Uncharacterized protein n=1 Tax=bacterium (Candidatus Blackallbacteria) CG17_big_fil_post_rev_8_21_14_2_50_48_46 TaxID=2014261 RepID=A0A2M7GAE1_9BACT|nr:MAG: hypothetical protein COW64_12415 [bacterium (Candidatus Blackallbacteria) CG18_big_fil_WC_8_21_14_2_50_49_26]PIW19106.1 MAG: hypothetical protein COW36_03060 [bacterium (Candidatus Blackallbacteria) CG17_big_fil_post_rev_8_21_14_2_50_48_46]PIW44527.1 MAG: hypothetical protein COW20_23060 [bacterium (Candidatus Blackallbacteria) CG13_big_fil_rev_8_21_14_2_50_49_14]